MSRWLMIGSMVGLLTMTTGCLHHNTRSNCGSCQSGACPDTSCNTGQCGQCNACEKHDGLLGKIGSRLKGDKGCGCVPWRPGCVAGPVGWQQGGLNYSSHLHPGAVGHNAPAALENRPFQPGPPSAQVGYPYYSHRGPRDFLLDNPPSIGR